MESENMANTMAMAYCFHDVEEVMNRTDNDPESMEMENTSDSSEKVRMRNNTGQTLYATE